MKSLIRWKAAAVVLQMNDVSFDGKYKTAFSSSFSSQILEYVHSPCLGMFMFFPSAVRGDWKQWVSKQTDVCRVLVVQLGALQRGQSFLCTGSHGEWLPGPRQTRPRRGDDALIWNSPLPAASSKESRSSSEGCLVCLEMTTRWQWSGFRLRAEGGAWSQQLQSKV